MLVQVDRTRSLQDLIGINNVSTYYEPCEQDAGAALLREFDTERLDLELLVDQRYVKRRSLARKIEVRTAELKAAGVVLADAWIGGWLLAHPEHLPDAWKSIADSDTPSREAGQVRFEGTVFSHRVHEDRHVVLGAMLARGRWSYGMSASPPSQEDMDPFEPAGGYPARYFSVVLRPE